MRSPYGQVNAGTPQDPSSHYTTRTGDDKTKIPNTGTIENTDNGNSVDLTQVCVLTIAVQTRASPSPYLESTETSRDTLLLYYSYLTQVCVLTIAVQLRASPSPYLESTETSRDTLLLYYSYLT